MQLLYTGVLTCAFVALFGCGAARESGTKPAGADTTAKTDVLKTGSKALQRDSPVDQMDVYLAGFHPMKEAPQHQMEAHHFCRQVNESFAQCALFDGNMKEANLNGVEYIISEKLFDSLAADEKQYWHPHNGEILSGQLVAPGLPDVAEKELLRGKMNSYGKTWHVWMTNQGQKLPVGLPMLAWSFSRDGEARAGLVEERDKKMGIDTKDIRNKRQDLTALAKPQVGVDALKGEFGRPTTDIPGVTDKQPQGTTGGRR